MKINQLEKILLEYVKQGNCFAQEVRNVLIRYKNEGGTQEEVVAILNTIKEQNPNNPTIEHGADDILDIVTGFCSAVMRVW